MIYVYVLCVFTACVLSGVFSSKSVHVSLRTPELNPREEPRTGQHDDEIPQHNKATPFSGGRKGEKRARERQSGKSAIGRSARRGGGRIIISS